MAFKRLADRLAGRGVQTRAVWSKDAVTTRLPSGLNAALYTSPSCPFSGSPICSPLAASQKPYMGDYRIGLVNSPRVPLARVIAASSAFPPFLSPVVLDNPGHFEPVEGADLNGKPEYTQRLYLADGGVYDNVQNGKAVPPTLDHRSVHARRYKGPQRPDQRPRRPGQHERGAPGRPV